MSFLVSSFLNLSSLTVCSISILLSASGEEDDKNISSSSSRPSSSKSCLEVSEVDSGIMFSASFSFSFWGERQE